MLLLLLLVLKGGGNRPERDEGESCVAIPRHLRCASTPTTKAQPYIMLTDVKVMQIICANQCEHDC
jgi:hypothetical protein